jgi:hypothetical protein
MKHARLGKNQIGGLAKRWRSRAIRSYDVSFQVDARFSLDQIRRRVSASKVHGRCYSVGRRWLESGHPHLDPLGYQQEPELICSILEFDRSFPELQHSVELVHHIVAAAEQGNVVERFGVG